MKYLSVLFFAIALAWTWNTINSKPSLGSETHSGIQSAMAQLVRATITAKRPQAQNFLIQKMRTEEKDNGEVNVYFQYAFSEPDSEGQMVTSQVSGDATLQKTNTTNSAGAEQWSLKRVHATNDVLTFEKGLVITPGADPVPPPASEPPAAAKPEEGPAEPGH